MLNEGYIESEPLIPVVEEEENMDIMNSQKASSLDYTQVEHDLRTNINNGLTTDDALHRQRLYGFNEFDVGEETPLWRKYLDQVCP